MTSDSCGTRPTASRRRTLGLLAGGVATLAGCGGVADGPDTPTATPGPLRDARRRVDEALSTLAATEVVQPEAGRTAVGSNDGFKPIRETPADEILAPLSTAEDELEAADEATATEVAALRDLVAYTRRKYETYEGLAAAFGAFAAARTRLGSESGSFEAAVEPAARAEDAIVAVAATLETASKRLDAIAEAEVTLDVPAFELDRERTVQDLLGGLVAAFEPAFVGLAAGVRGIATQGRAITAIEDESYERAYSLATAAGDELARGRDRLAAAVDAEVPNYQSRFRSFNCLVGRFAEVNRYLVEAADAYRNGSFATGNDRLRQFTNDLEDSSGRCSDGS